MVKSRELSRSSSFNNLEETFTKICQGKRITKDDVEIKLSNGKTLTKKNILRVMNLSKNFTVYEVNDSNFFREAVLLAKKSNSNGDCLAIRNTKEYDNARLFITKNGEAGIAVEKDGHIFSLFKNETESKKNGIGKVAEKLMYIALSNGGNKLDCFDGFLPRFYCRLGFEPVTKTAFKLEFTGGGNWDFSKKGTPDLIFMRHNGDSVYKIFERKNSYPKFEDYNIKSSRSLEIADKILGCNSNKKHGLDRSFSI